MDKELDRISALVQQIMNPILGTAPCGVYLRFTLERRNAWLRSKFEYAAAIWDSVREKQLRSPELIQNNSTRFILRNHYSTASVSSMKSNLVLRPLATRRRIFRLSYFSLVICHHPTQHPNFMAQPYYLSHRTDHQHRVGTCVCITRLVFFTLTFATSLKEWNEFPTHIAYINNNENFRNALANIV